MSGRLASLSIAALVKLSGLSWWQVRYVGGQTLAEWETAQGAPRTLLLPFAGLSQRTRWEELDHSRVIEARLHCPNGEIAEVKGGPYRLLQFKCGLRGPGISVRHAHVLGRLIDELGGCDCWAWESDHLVRFQDNVLNFQRYGVGPLSLEALGVKP